MAQGKQGSAEHEYNLLQMLLAEVKVNKQPNPQQEQIKLVKGRYTHPFPDRNVDTPIFL